jgi:hypothetical protein
MAAKKTARTGTRPAAPNVPDDEQFRNAIRDRLKQPRTEGDDFNRVLKVLKDTAEAIRETRFQQSHVVVRVEPGFSVNLGQQFKIVVSVPRQGFSDILFKAYIPTDGFPVTLDLFGQRDEQYNDLTSLRKAILRFMERPEVRLRLDGLAELESD